MPATAASSLGCYGINHREMGYDPGKDDALFIVSDEYRCACLRERLLKFPRGLRGCRREVRHSFERRR